MRVPKNQVNLTIMRLITIGRIITSYFIRITSILILILIRHYFSRKEKDTMKNIGPVRPMILIIFPIPLLELIQFIRRISFASCGLIIIFMETFFHCSITMQKPNSLLVGHTQGMREIIMAN